LPASRSHAASPASTAVNVNAANVVSHTVAAACQIASGCRTRAQAAMRPARGDPSRVPSPHTSTQVSAETIDWIVNRIQAVVRVNPPVRSRSQATSAGYAGPSHPVGPEPRFQGGTSRVQTFAKP